MRFWPETAAALRRIVRAEAVILQVVSSGVRSGNFGNGKPNLVLRCAHPIGVDLWNWKDHFHMLRLIDTAGIAAVVFSFSIFYAEAEPFQKPATRLEFEAASIRSQEGPLNPGFVGVHGGPGTDDPGRITYRGVPLSFLISRAYGVDRDQIVGRTEKLGDNWFIVTSTIPPGTTEEQFRVMLQNLLAERFHLVLHHESRDVPGYELTISATGPKFRKWAPDPNAPPRLSGMHLQAGQGGFDWTVTRQPPMIHVTSRESMIEFAKELPGLWFMEENTRGDTDRDERVKAGFRGGPAEPKPRFVDKTGLTGEYELIFDYEGAMVPGRSSAGGPTLAEALEKQMGLKLTKVKRMPLDVLVIDSADSVPVGN